MKRLIISSLSIFVCFIAQAQYEVFPINTNPLKPVENGFYYNLPQSGIRVNIRLNKSILHKGIYSGYAEKLLGLSNVIEEDKISYELADIEIQNFAIPDPKQLYFVSAKKTNMNIEWNANGTLASINDLTKKNTSILNSMPIHTSGKQNEEEKSFKLGNIFAELNVYQKFDTIFKQVKVDTMLMVQKIIKSDIVKKTDAQKAEEMANRIIESRQKRNDLLSGMQEISYDPNTIRYMNEQLTAMENEYMLCFSGYTENISYTYEFEFIPNSDTIYPIARFSNTSGIIPLQKEDENAQTLYLILEKQSSANNAIEKFNKKSLIPTATNGFFYRLPLDCKISVYLDQYALQQARFPIAQWGKNLSLPAVDIRLNLDPMTGEIRYLEYLQGKK